MKTKGSVSTSERCNSCTSLIASSMLNREFFNSCRVASLRFFQIHFDFDFSTASITRSNSYFRQIIDIDNLFSTKIEFLFSYFLNCSHNGGIVERRWAVLLLMGQKASKKRLGSNEVFSMRRASHHAQAASFYPTLVD